eukprot:sb/3475027/
MDMKHGLGLWACEVTTVTSSELKGGSNVEHVKLDSQRKRIENQWSFPVFGVKTGIKSIIKSLVFDQKDDFNIILQFSFLIAILLFSVLSSISYLKVNYRPSLLQSCLTFHAMRKRGSYCNREKKEKRTVL